MEVEVFVMRIVVRVRNLNKRHPLPRGAAREQCAAEVVLAVAVGSFAGSLVTSNTSRCLHELGRLLIGINISLRHGRCGGGSGSGRCLACGNALRAASIGR